MIIYRDGKEIYEIKDFKVVGKFMDVAILDCTIKSAVPLSFEIGDYVVYDYNGLTYSLYDVPTPKKQARSGSYGEAFIYDLKFKSDMEQLSICPFLDMVANDNGVHYTTLPSFSTFEDVYGIAARIQANMDYLYPNKWRIEVANTTDAELRENLAEAKEYSISGQSCLEGLKKIYDTWGVGFIHSVENGVNVISIGKSAGTTSLFCYGKGQGLRTVKKSLQNTDQFVTRVYAYGSNRNIPARWYNEKGYIGEAQYAPNLMIPPTKWVDGKPQGAYIDAIFGGEDRVEKYGLRIKTFSYDGSNGRDEIFPSVEKVTAGDIRAAKQEIGESQYIPSSRYSDSARMDLVLIGSKVEDDGIKAESGYQLFSEKLVADVEEITKTEIIAEPIKGKPEKYVLQSPVNTIPICSFNIEKTANYRISEINDMAVFTKNDLESTVKATWYMQTPSGGYLDLKKSITFTDKLKDTLQLPLINFTASEPGTYTLVLRLEVTWSVDYVVPQIDGDIALSYTIKGEQIEIARGERILDSFFDVYIKQIGFDLNTVTASDGSYKTISFKSGMCAGRSFVVTQCVYDKERDAWQLTCKRTQDGSVSQTFPNNIFQIVSGDQFILLNINMPDLYVYTAMQRLYNTALADLKHYSNPQFVVSPEIDNIQMARSPQILKEGMYMPIEDADISINDDILIDGVTITENGKELRKFDVTLRNDKIYNRFSRIATSISALEKSIEEAKKNSVNVPMAEIVTDEVTLDSTKESNKLFFFDEETGAVRTKYDLVVEKSITFGGAKEGEGEEGGGSAGITTFDVFVGNNGPYSLQDGKVNLPAYPVVPNALPNPFKLTINGTPYDGSAPVDIEIKAGVDDAQLSEYAKKEWVTEQGYIKEIPSDVITEDELSSKGYATEKWVNGQGFLTAHQSLTHLLSKEEAADTYQPKGDYAVLDDLNSYLLTSTAKNTYATKTALNNAIQAHDELREEFDALNGLLTDDTSGYIDTWNEVKSFLDGYSESQDLATILSGMNKDIANRATIEALNAATLRIDTLETTLSTEQGYIDTLQGYFTNGKAKKAIADGNGNNIVDTYATKIALKDVADKVASLQDMWFFDEAHANTIRTLYNVVVDKAISFGGYGESSGNGGGITTVTKQMVLDALGYTPYDAANPKGYITASALNGYAKLTDIPSLSGYATQSWVTENYQPKGDYLTPATGVTLSTDQTITGIKTFSNGLKIGSTAIAEKTKNSTKYVEIDGNLVVTGAISFGGFGEGDSTSGGITSVTKDMVIDALGYTPYNATNPKGYITASSIPTSLKNPAALSWSGYSSGSYDGSSAKSITIPTTLPASDVYAWAKKSSLAASDVPNLDWSKITSGKPTTLSGYGITDALDNTTKYALGDAVGGNAVSANKLTDNSTYNAWGQTFFKNGVPVAIPTTADLTAADVAVDSLTIGAIAITEKSKNSTTYLEIDGDLVVTGAISFGGYGESSGNGSGITAVTKDMVIDALGYTPYNAANPSGYITSSALSGYAKISDIPSLSGYATQTWVENKGYFTSSSFTKANIKSTLGISDWALAASKPTYTKSDVGLGNVQNTAVYTRNLGVNGVNWTFASTYYTEDGTSTSIYAPTTAGTAGQYLVSNGAGAPYWHTIDPYDYNISRTANTVLAAPNGYAGSATFRKLVSADIPNLDWSKITSGKPTTVSGYGITDAITTSNIGSQSVNYATSAGSATKLTNTRTIWGRDFDGTANITGNLYSVGSIEMTGAVICGGTTSGAFIGSAAAGIGSSNKGALMYAYGSNPLHFWTNSTERMRITGDGKVGIGTNAPEYKLDVSGISRIMGSSSAGVIIGKGGNAIDGYLNNAYGPLFLNYTSSDNIILAMGGGNVGIGTTYPQYKLDVNGKIRFNAVTIWGQSFDGTGNVSGALSLNTSKLYWQLDSNNYYISCPAHSGGAMLEYKAYSGHSFLGGNVAIGTTPSTSYKLDVSGIGRFINSSDSSGVVIANQGNTIDGYYNGWGNLYLNYSSSGDVYLAYGGGNVGIGLIYPAHKLDILSSDWIGMRVKRNKSTGYGSAMVFENTSGVLGVMGWNQEGDVIIREGGSNKLIEGGTSGLKINYGTTIKGNLVVTGAITFGSASDRRLKEDIQSMSYEQAISVVMGLNPVTFKWNTTATELGKLSGISDGFIADEYEKLIPNSGRAIWANYRAIDYTRAIPYVTAVVQNHETRLEYITAVAQNHETRLEKAERRIKELENELKQYRRA